MIARLPRPPRARRRGKGEFPQPGDGGRYYISRAAAPRPMMPTDWTLPAGWHPADVIIGLVIALYAIEDLRRGFLFGLLSLAGLLLALVAALVFYGPLADLLTARFGLPYALAKPAA